MLHFFIFNSETFAQGEDPREHKRLSALLSYEVPGWEWMIKSKRALATWDGRRSFYDQRTGTFPSGLLPLVLKKLAKVRIKFELHDQRISLLPLHPEILDPNIWHEHLKNCGLNPDLRKSTYQVEGAKQTLAFQLSGVPWPRGLHSYPTGSGKTALAALLLMSIGRRALFMVERLDLLHQTREVFEKILGSKIGIIAEGQLHPEIVTVSTIQTIVKKLHIPEVRNYLRATEVVIMDECQNLTGSKEMRDRYLLLLSELQNAPFRFAISGTPLMRGDLGDVYLRGAFGSIVSQLKAATLIEQNLLARPTIRMIRMQEPKLDEDTPGDIVYDLGIVHNLERNTLVADLAAKASKRYPTMILVKRLRHARMIQELLRGKGLRVPTMTHKVPSKARREAIKQFERGELSLILASSIFEIGIDIESLRFLIVASGDRSAIKAIQRLGRGMRKKRGSNTLTLVDFLDETHPLLEENSYRRLKAYRSQGHEIKILRAKKGRS